MVKRRRRERSRRAACARGLKGWTGVEWITELKQFCRIVSWYLQNYITRKLLLRHPFQEINFALNRQCRNCFTNQVQISQNYYAHEFSCDCDCLMFELWCIDSLSKSLLNLLFSGWFSSSKWFWMLLWTESKIKPTPRATPHLLTLFDGGIAILVNSLHIKQEFAICSSLLQFQCT